MAAFQRLYYVCLALLAVAAITSACPPCHPLAGCRKFQCPCLRNGRVSESTVIERYPTKSTQPGCPDCFWVPLVTCARSTEQHYCARPFQPCTQ